MLLLKLEIASSIRYPMLRLSCLASVGIHICISSKIASHPALRKRKPSRMLEFLIACDWWKPHLRFYRIPPTHTLHDLNVKTLSAEPLLHRTHSNSDFLLDPRPIIHWQTLSVTDSLTHCLTTIWKTWLMWLISSTPLFAQISAPKFRNLSQMIKICVNAFDMTLRSYFGKNTQPSAMMCLW